MGVWFGVSVESCQITKNVINLDLIKIVEFCLETYDFLRWVYGSVYGWLIGWLDEWVGMWGHVKSLKSNKSGPN